MGLARELSMGTRKRRTSTIATGPYIALARITSAAKAGHDVDIQRFKDLIDSVGAQAGRMRFKESVIYMDANKTYRELTGVRVGPEVTAL